MPRHFEQRVLPYTPNKVFALVADIERYPEFLPWCQSASIRTKKGNVVTAELVVGTKHINDTFVSHVTLDKPARISVVYGDGPLTHLTNEWRFTPQAKGACELSFYVDFAFRSSLLSVMMNAVFDKAFRKMARAFEARAQALYG